MLTKAITKAKLKNIFEAKLSALSSENPDYAAEAENLNLVYHEFLRRVDEAVEDPSALAVLVREAIGEPIDEDEVLSTAGDCDTPRYGTPNESDTPLRNSTSSYASSDYGEETSDALSGIDMEFFPQSMSPL